MSFQTEIEFLVTVAKAGYLYSFFVTPPLRLLYSSREVSPQR